MVLLLGASGAIGKILHEELKKRGLSVIPISDYDKSFMSYKELFAKTIQPELIVDCSKKDLNFYLKLQEKYGSYPIIHFSTHRLKLDIRFDDYDYYKLDVLKVINVFKNKTVIYGDLFWHNNGYLGFWSKLKKDSKIVSYRTINETDISEVASLVVGKNSATLYKPTKLKQLYMHKSVFNMAINLKLYKVFQIFNYHLVK